MWFHECLNFDNYIPDRVQNSAEVAIDKVKFVVVSSNQILV